MRIVMFYQSVISDWNHGNAHFLRGIASELQSRGNEVTIYEPRDGWSIQNLLADYGQEAVIKFQLAFPSLQPTRYDLDTLNLDQALEGADLAVVHEWNDPALVKRVGEHRASRQWYRLLFHDTHHRSVTDEESMAAFDLSNYDGVLAYGSLICELYKRRGWIKRAWTWHEAADVRVFKPIPGLEPVGDLVWIGNWGDEERTAELYEFLIEPVQELALKTRIYGVRYPDGARADLRKRGLDYCGWLPNHDVPSVFARFRMTVHVPRRPYVQALPGIPTIRPFEAMACGIPLVSAAWQDIDGLFTEGKDYLVAHDGREMTRLLQMLLSEPEAARDLARHALKTIHERHTCKHRVDELESICNELAVRNLRPRQPLVMQDIGQANE